MLFKGRLRLPSDPGEGIPIDLELEDVYLSLDSGGEDFGEWRLDTVEIKRLFSNQFSMLLDGEEMVFIADDALGFAYDGLSAVEDVKSRLSKRRLFKGRKPKRREQSATQVDDELEDDMEVEQAPPEPRVPDAPMPEVVPFFPETSPSFADSVAESTTDDDSIAPVAPRPIEPRSAEVEAETSESSPAAPVVDPPAPTTQPPAAPPAAPQAEPASPPLEDLPLDEDDDDFVIEEVAAYGYVPNLASAVPSEPDVDEDDETLDIEEADVATGDVQRDAHPLGEPETAPRASEAHPLGEPSTPEPEPTFEPEPTAVPEPMSQTVRPEPTPTPERVVMQDPAVPAARSGDQTGFGQWSSNGQAMMQPEPETFTDEPDREADGPQTQRAGRHERSSGKSRSLFGRKKSREPEEHDHRYESSKTVGGITRNVCAVCGHVSFAGEDVYQDW